MRGFIRFTASKACFYSSRSQWAAKAAHVLATLFRSTRGYVLEYATQRFCAYAPVSTVSVIR